MTDEAAAATGAMAVGAVREGAGKAASVVSRSFKKLQTMQ
jgi:hypothetical protein